MPSANGHGPKRAILYARVSTEEQVKSGYSLRQQMERLREYAATEGYEVLEEVTDPGQSGASLERPGMDRVRDLVAAGSVSVVLAQDRDRFAREPAYHYLLKREFEEHGATIRSLNDRGDESPEGELTDGILDQLAKFERAKMAERSRRGKIRKAREGKIISSSTPDYGFAFNEDRDNYVVDPERMAVVRRIFEMIGAEGASISSVKKTLDRERVPTPAGARFWSRPFVKQCILDDVYRSHSVEEIEGLLAPGVAAQLDLAKRYGVWWYNRKRVSQRQVSEGLGEERRYRKRSTVSHKPKDEWIAVPVPDSGIPREWIDAARSLVENNSAPSAAGDRFWELSGGVARCAECGSYMIPSTTRAAKDKPRHYYYRCATRHAHGKEACPHTKMHRADKLEPTVWEFVCGILQDPEQLTEDLYRMIELEKEGMRGDPQEAQRVWLQKLSEVEEERRGYQRLAARGKMTDAEFDEALAELEETRQTADRELENLRGRTSRIEELERDAEALVESYTQMAPEALESLEPSERHQLYAMLGLRVSVKLDDALEVTWYGDLGGGSRGEVCNMETVYSWVYTGR